MADQIALIEAPIHETTGTPGPRVLHDVARFEILGVLCHVRTNPEGDTLFLSGGRRDFAVSLLDLAATAALAVEAHLKGEIRARVLASRGVAAADPDTALTEHHFGAPGRVH